MGFEQATSKNIQVELYCVAQGRKLWVCWYFCTTRGQNYYIVMLITSFIDYILQIFYSYIFLHFYSLDEGTRPLFLQTVVSASSSKDRSLPHEDYKRIVNISTSRLPGISNSIYLNEFTAYRLKTWYTIHSL